MKKGRKELLVAVVVLVALIIAGVWVLSRKNGWLWLTLETDATCKYGDTINLRLAVMGEGSPIEEFEYVTIQASLNSKVIRVSLLGFPVTVYQENFQRDRTVQTYDRYTYDFSLLLEVPGSPQGYKLDNEEVFGEVALCEIWARAEAVKGDVQWPYDSDEAYVAVDLRS